jgi:GntR family transcriptional regulator
MTNLIDPYDAIPKYHQLASMIRKKIDDGEWEPRSAIPSERVLESTYNISRTTIREAIHHLVREGYLYREHGRGTFVSPKKLVKGLMDLTSFSEDMKNRDMIPGQTILEIAQVNAPLKICELLDISPEKKVVMVRRIRTGDGKPIGLQTSYSVLPETETITTEELEKYGSLYRLYREKFQIIPTEADETHEVTIASLIEAKLLDVEEGTPLLLSERLSYSQYRKPVEYVKILYRGDRYRYYVRLIRK